MRKEKGSEREEAFVEKAYRLFDEFSRELRPYHDRCAANERFWKAEHWNEPKRERNQPQPVTPMLFSTVENSLADLMDNYPEAVLLGEGPEDDERAKVIGDIVKYILKRRRYRATYRDKCRMALKYGTSVQEVYWDRKLYNGLGDVNVRALDVRNFFWDPLYPTVQEGRACFKVSYHTFGYFAERYPGKAEQIGQNSGDGLSGAPKMLRLIEYWYKQNGNVHMAKLCSRVLLEDSRVEQPEGAYSHGKYPFIMEPLYKQAGRPEGLGMIDMLKDAQIYADKLDQIIMQNALSSSKPKLLINRAADLDENALADGEVEFVHGSRIDDSALRWFQAAPLSYAVYNHHQAKLESIREQSGQNQFNRGEGGRGVTAASAIIALQEAGSKRSRLLIEQLYDGFEDVVRMMIEVIDENYTEKRRFRIIESEGGERLVQYGGKEDACDFDLSVHVQKQSPFMTAYQNELAVKLFQLGMLDKADALEMMSFEGKHKLMDSVKEKDALQGMIENMAAVNTISDSKV